MAETNLKKSKQGYGYKYTELAQINEYLESINTRYYQYIEPVDGTDYIYTVPIVEGKELSPRRGCRVVNAALQGKSNEAQEQGSAITYARRYSLLMAFGLATEDDDAESLTRNNRKAANDNAKVRAERLKVLNDMCSEHNLTPAKLAEYNNQKFDPGDLEMINNMIACLEKKYGAKG